MGTIKSIGINVGKLTPMSYKDEVKIISNYGIEGDRFSKKNDNRQIMIVDADLYDVHNLEQGVLRENLLVSGLDLNNCKEGQKIIVNDSIEMKVALVKDACASADYNDPEVIKKLEGNMYIFATPISTGIISREDKIEIV
ncbi:MAG: hypothetical protein CL761_04900 [Chloroflexi bacterium]|nr:hypothetical protein [Chloroflexota bacterium]